MCSFSRKSGKIKYASFSDRIVQAFKAQAKKKKKKAFFSNRIGFIYIWKSKDPYFSMYDVLFILI